MIQVRFLGKAYFLLFHFFLGDDVTTAYEYTNPTVQVLSTSVVSMLIQYEYWVQQYSVLVRFFFSEDGQKI